MIYPVGAVCYLGLCWLATCCLRKLHHSHCRLIWSEYSLLLTPLTLAIEVGWLLLNPESERNR